MVKTGSLVSRTPSLIASALGFMTPLVVCASVPGDDAQTADATTTEVEQLLGTDAGREGADGVPQPLEASEAPGDWERPFDLSGKYLTGEWGGARNKLEESGFKLKFKLMNQFMVNMYGGRETKNGSDFAGSYEINLYLDFEKMKLIDGASFFMRGKGTWGGGDSGFDREKVGALFKTNQDASSEQPIFVDKWWWTQELWDDSFELRLGRLEPVKDLFDTSEIIGNEDTQFLNRTLVRNVTIPPEKGLGVFAKWKVTDDVYLQAAVIDADARERQTNFNTAFHDTDHFRVYAEVGWKPTFETDRGPHWGHYRIGTWYDPKQKTQFFDTLGGRRAQRFQSGDWGLFMGFDQMLWKEKAEPEDKQGLSLAARYGHARGEVNLIEHFWSVAAQYEGLIPERDKDVLGLGVAQAILADESRRVRSRADRETVFELYYAIRVSPWLEISPDFQFIVNGGGDKDDRNTMVAGLRVMLDF